MSTTTSRILRFALAFSLAYPAITALFNPSLWIGYLPGFISALPLSDVLALHLFGFVEVVLALWLVSGKKIFWPSVASAITLFLIIVLNFSQIDVLFRDVPILMIAIALSLEARKRQEQTVDTEDKERAFV